MTLSARGLSPRRLLHGLFTLGVSLLAFWFLWSVMREVGFESVAGRLGHASLLLVFIGVVVTALRFLMLALRWEILLRVEAPVGLRQVAPVLMAGNFLNLVAPALRVAGPILRAYYLSRETGKPRARFYGTIVADQTANFIPYTVATAAAGSMITLTSGFSVSPWMAFGMMAAMVGGLAVCWLGLRRIARGGSSRIATWLLRGSGGAPVAAWRVRLAAWWDHLAHALATSLIGTGAWWPTVALSFVIFLQVVAVQWLCFAAVGGRVGFPEACFAIAGAGFVQIMAGAPGGVGVTEGSLVWVLVSLGLDKETVVAAVLLARFLNYGVLLLWGGLSFLFLQKRYGMPEAETAAA